MVVTNHTSGFGVFAAMAFVPILIVIIALVRGKPIVATLAGGSFLALLAGSMIWGFASHSVIRTSSTAMPAEWDSNSVVWSADDPGPASQRTQDMMRPPLSAMQATAGRFTIAILGLIFLPILLILGVVLFARAMSRKQPGQERCVKGESWHDVSRRGERGEWGRGTVVLGIVLVIGILGAKTIFGLRMAQRQAIQQHNEMARTEMRAHQNLRAPVQIPTLSAQHPVLQDTRPLEMVIEEFERPRIQLDQPDKATAEPAPAEQHLAAEEHASAEDLKHAEAPTTAAADSEPASSARDETHGASPTEIRTTPEKTVLIEMDADKLSRFGLTDGSVASILDQRGVWKGALTVARDRSRKQITAVGAIRDSEMLPRVLLTAREGRPVYLSDVATITEKLLDPPAESGDRPAWVDAPSQRYGDTLREVVEVGEYSTTSECVKRSQQRVMVAVWEHLQSLIGHYVGVASFNNHGRDADSSSSEDLNRYYSAIGQLGRAGITYDFIRREIITNEYIEEVERSFGKMHRMYTQLEFRPGVDQQLRARWIRAEQSGRVQAVSLVAIVSLALVGLVWGLLKVDTMTRGYYSKRLFLGVPALLVLAFFLIVFVSA
jgi:hypothetical protein